MALCHKALVADEIDGGTTVTDSWEIARYREHRYPERPRLFGGECGECGEAEAFVVKSGCELVVHPALVRMIVPHIYARRHVKDQPYYRQSREARGESPSKNSRNHPHGVCRPCATRSRR
jgi:glutathione S-transferase